MPYMCKGTLNLREWNNAAPCGKGGQCGSGQCRSGEMRNIVMTGKESMAY